jgi:hypothetical protein
MLLLGPHCLFDTPPEILALIFIESLLAKESRMLCSATYSLMILDGARSSESSE